MADTCWVSRSMEEKVGLPAFSNVTIGPVTIARQVEDTPEARAEALRELSAELLEDMAAERAIVLEAIKAFAESGGYGDVRDKR